MRKLAKVKPKVDYRHRWPTQQTLVESRVSLEHSRLGRRWKFHLGWLRRLKRRSSPGPGKSTHPYDTGLGEQGSDSGPGPGSRSVASSTHNNQGCWKLISRIPHATSPPAPVPKVSLTKPEPRPETPKTPVQFLRLLTSPRKSPLPPSRNATPFDCDKAAVRYRYTNAGIQTQDLQPEIVRPIAQSPNKLSTKIKSFPRRIFRRRRPARPLAARSLT
ncbi:hypothetical protein F5Y12DRAFT_709714 [Xylaria sp. FL1777]|nr:hypothetical protein F5Y12DRAFT_709714 [Xylaria sp. FL1777]